MGEETDGSFIVRSELRPIISFLGKQCWHLWSPEVEYIWKSLGETLTASKCRSNSRLYTITSIVGDICDDTLVEARAANKILLKELVESEVRVDLSMAEDRASGKYCGPATLRRRLVRFPLTTQDAINGTNAYAASNDQDAFDTEYQAPVGRLGRCEKKFPTRPYFTPGLFLLSCCCSRPVVYVAVFMDSGESPRAFVTEMMNRWNIPPAILFYDNACHFHLYAMHRFRLYFFNSRFICDRLHESNHSTCDCRYHCSNHTAADVTNSNTQASEQVNNLVTRSIADSVRYMNLWNAVVYVSAFFSAYGSRTKPP